MKRKISEMNKFVVLIISTCLTILLFLAPIVCAEEGGDTSFTLNKAIEMVLHNNTLIKQAIENQKAAIEEQRSARADFLPKISAGYSYTRLKDSPYMKTDGTQIDIADNDQYHWDLTLSQPLFTGFALSTRYEMAKLGVDVKDAEKEQAVLDVVKQVKAAYFNILLTKKFLLVADEAVNQLESHVTDAEKFYEQGIIPYNDLLRSKVALADALQNRVRAEAIVEMAVSAFNTLLRIDLNKKTDIDDLLDITPYSFELTNCIKEAIEKRPELKALRLALKNADHVVTLAQSAYYPEVALVGSYEQNGDNPSATENDYGNTHNASVTLQARWTFFEWGKTRAEVNKYRRNKSSLVEKTKGIKDSIKLEVKSAFLSLKVAEQNIQTAQKSLVQSKENWRITNLQYQQQMTTSTEVLDARTFLTRAETNYYGALYGYMISLAELERAVGREEYAVYGK